jgi:hypothetical protein
VVLTAAPRPRAFFVVCLCAGSLLAVACRPASDPKRGDGSGAAPMRASDAPGSERRRILGEFLAEHWVLPIPLQGEPPASFAEADASLEPEVCGACHPKQFNEWKGSLHAGAFSPGLSGQLIEGELAAPAEVRQCQTCHAPLGEQQPYGADLAPSADFDAELRERGVMCAACHVRAHRHFGPPRRPELPPAPEPVPHGGFEARLEFRESRFCATCHQFFDAAGIAGKPIENTFIEWQQSPFAAEGRSCQSCHMPDRAHTWRGIHDAEMVRAAVEVDLFPGDLSSATLEAALVLLNREVGHAFPTYVTPRVFLAVWQADGEGRELAGTRSEAAIGREIDFASQPWRELLDTRVLPEESVRLDYVAARAKGAVALVGRVTVDPDFHYRGVFDSMRRELTNPEARDLIEEAYRRTSVSSYVLTEIRRPLPCPVAAD